MRQLAILALLLCAFVAAAFAADDKPLDLGGIAYLGGAYTPDGRYFVFAQFPKDGASEIKACDTRDGKVQSLGKVKLITPEPAGQPFFHFSMGVLAAENDLSIVYVNQYGNDMDLNPKSALAWDVKAGTTAAAKNTDEIAAQLKKRSGPGAGAKVTMEESNAEAVELRKKYQPLAKVPDLVGQKTLVVDLGGNAATKVNVTEAFRELYATVVTDYPNNKLEFDKGNVLCSDSLGFVALCGKWIFANCGVYAHYGIHGRGYNRLIAIHSETGKMLSYPGIGAHTASGIKMEPDSDAFYPSPDGKSIAGLSGNHLTLYRLPE